LSIGRKKMRNYELRIIARSPYGIVEKMMKVFIF